MKPIYFLIGVFIVICSSSFTQVTDNPLVNIRNDSIVSIHNGKEIVGHMDKYPQYPGGLNNMLNFISKKLKYPKTAFENNIEGIVVLVFIITSDGEIKDIKVVESICEELDNEAIRVLKKMPKWKPGEIDGQPVDVYFSIPITFKI